MVWMKKSLSWLFMGTAMSIGMAFFADGALAQNSNTGAFQEFGTDDDGADIFGDTSDPYELIHRAILAPSMSSEEFLENQNRAITGEAQDFKLRQQELIRQQQGVDAEADITVDSDDL
jgi:hypothetical protein